MSPRKRLERADQQIRLLELTKTFEAHQDIVCVTKIVNILSDKVPEYRALSYAWGSQDVLHRVTLDGNAFSVGQNLYNALRQLCTEDVGTPIWIDAICIIQEDLEEKNLQIPLMKEIYSRASKVVIWLGSLQGNSLFLSQEATVVQKRQPLVDLLGTFRGKPRKELRAIKFKNRAGHKEVIEIFSRPYWRRLWIIQEVVLSDSNELRYGNFHLKWDDIQESWYRLQASGDINAFEEVGKIAEAHGYDFKVFQTLILSQYRGRRWQRWLSGVTEEAQKAFLREKDMLSLLFAFGRAECSNVRDRIFGLTGVARGCCVHAIGDIDYDISITELVRRVWEHSFTHDDEDLGNWLYMEDNRTRPDQRELMLTIFDNGSVEYAKFKANLSTLGGSRGREGILNESLRNL